MSAPTAVTSTTRDRRGAFAGVGTLSSAVLSSLLVVVIVGAVVALVTKWSLAGAQPATTDDRVRRATERDREPEDRKASTRRAPRGHRSGPPDPGDASVPPSADVGPLASEDVRIPWWRRLRAGLELGVIVTLLGAGLALVLAASAFALVAVLDRALG